MNHSEITPPAEAEGILASLLHKCRQLAPFRRYYLVFFLYALPFLFLALFILDEYTLNKTGMLFWLLFLVSPVPCGTLGFVLGLTGWIRARKKKSRVNKVIGMIAMLLGAGGLIAGIFGILLIIVVIS
ncbi:hypothetical protein V9K67_22640 [Paraflavisolibacter sp. H34]|uniref:hypothetical protein n=1 Tax=Huijunlia imazamoxiresistens TaxID=3127457 RepID=UPI0030181FDA